MHVWNVLHAAGWNTGRKTSLSEHQFIRHPLRKLWHIYRKFKVIQGIDFYHHYNPSRTIQMQVPVLLTSKARIHRINFWLSRPFRCQVTRTWVFQMGYVAFGTWQFRYIHHTYAPKSSCTDRKCPPLCTETVMYRKWPNPFRWTDGRKDKVQRVGCVEGRCIDTRPDNLDTHI